MANKYLCVWGEGFPSTYDDAVHLEDDAFFTEDLGYDKEDLEEINNLNIGEVWTSYQGGHWILRVPDDFNPSKIHI